MHGHGGQQQLKLHYFNVKGRGELTRLILNHAGVQFEDLRYGIPQMGVQGLDYGQLKTSGLLPFGQLPVLECHTEGHTHYVAQSNAIVRFLAKRYGLMGECEGSAAMIDSLLEGTVDINNAHSAIRMGGSDQEKADATEKFYNETLPKNFGFINSFIKNGSHWLVGNRMSLADIAFFNTCDGLDHGKVDHCLQAFPALANIKQCVAHNLSHYLSNRPTTIF